MDTLRISTMQMLSVCSAQHEHIFSFSQTPIGRYGFQPLDGMSFFESIQIPNIQIFY